MREATALQRPAASEDGAITGLHESQRDGLSVPFRTHRKTARPPAFLLLPKPRRLLASFLQPSDLILTSPSSPGPSVLTPPDQATHCRSSSRKCAEGAKAKRAGAIRLPRVPPSLSKAFHQSPQLTLPPVLKPPHFAPKPRLCTPVLRVERRRRPRNADSGIGYILIVLLRSCKDDSGHHTFKFSSMGHRSPCRQRQHANLRPFA